VADTFNSIFEKHPAYPLGFAGTWVLLGLIWKDARASKKELMTDAQESNKELMTDAQESKKELVAMLELSRREAREDARELRTMFSNNARELRTMVSNDVREIRKMFSSFTQLYVGVLVIAVVALVLVISRPAVTTQMPALASWLPNL
jgi:hypothetical protein